METILLQLQNFFTPLLGDPSLRGGVMFLAVISVVIVMLIKSHRSSKQRAVMHENYQHAIYLLDGMIKRDPTNALAYWRKGEACEAMGMKDHAIHYYKTAHSLSPRAFSSNEVSDAFERINGFSDKRPIRKPALQTKFQLY